MKKIIALSVKHDHQRYPTVGDYTEAHGTVMFTISDMGNEEYESLVLIHELVEYLLVKKRGIAISTIDTFDRQFETVRPAGNTDEPGDHVNCPYRDEHRFAENIERQVCAALGIHWKDYDAAVRAL